MFVTNVMNGSTWNWSSEIGLACADNSIRYVGILIFENSIVGLEIFGGLTLSTVRATRIRRSPNYPLNSRNSI
jgi:hypothetical protein